MLRSFPKPLLIAGLLTIGALVPWFLTAKRSQRVGEPAGQPDATTVSATPTPNAIAKLARPAAMEIPATYAATRLKEIKADPARWVEVWQWRQEFAAADSPELQREVLGLARQIGPDALTAVLALALASEDPVVRLDAARSIALLPENRLRDGFALGVDAADPEIRTEVMDLINWLQPHLRPELLGVALASASADVQTRAIELLTDSPNPVLFAVLIEGLRTSSPEIRPLVEQAIADVVDRHFTNFEEASAWWAQNHENYDNLMSLIP